MNIKLASNEDLTITTKGGFTLTAPNKTGTLLTDGDAVTKDMIADALENIASNIVTAEDARVALTSLITALKNL